MEKLMDKQQVVNEAIAYCEKLVDALDRAERIRLNPLSVEREHKEGDVVITQFSDELLNLISGELRKRAEALKKEFWTKELKGL